MKIKSKSWIRLYTEVPDDPKVQALGGNLFKFWINCLCLSGRNDGKLPSDQFLSWSLREKLTNVSAWKRSLVESGLLDETPDGGFTPHGWNDRQYESDVSTPRVKTFRERKRKQDETVSPEVSGTVKETVSPLSVCSVSVSASVSEIKTTAILENFDQFWDVCQAAELPASEPDRIATGFEWRKLDFEAKLAAVKGLKDRISAGEFTDAAFRPLPQNYIKNRTWQRPVRASPASKTGPVLYTAQEQALMRAKKAIEEGGGY